MTYPGRIFRLLLGLASIVPLAGVITAFGGAVRSMFEEQPTGFTADQSEAAFTLFLALCLTLGVFAFALVAYYLRFIFRTDRIPSERKPAWAIVLFLGNVIAFPLLWFLFFWRDAEELLRSSR